MTKRRQKSCETVIDLEADGYEDHPSWHRTCWKHIQSHLCSSRKRIPKREAEEIEWFKYTSPCLLEIFPHPRRERSKKKLKPQNVVSKLKRKLDTKAFECYFLNLWRSFTEDQRFPFTYLDSLWFTMYRETSTRTNVLEWIKGKNVFSKEYVFVPIVCWGHWSLLILCHFGESFKSENTTPFMLLLDSLENAGPRRLEPEIRKFVLDIYRAEGKAVNKQLISQIPLLVPKVPQQRNDEECGNYVLYFINLFVQLQATRNNFGLDGYPFFIDNNWFAPESLETFCLKLETLQGDMD